MPNLKQAQRFIDSRWLAVGSVLAIISGWTVWLARATEQVAAEADRVDLVAQSIADLTAVTSDITTIRKYITKAADKSALRQIAIVAASDSRLLLVARSDEAVDTNWALRDTWSDSRSADGRPGLIQPMNSTVQYRRLISLGVATDSKTTDAGQAWLLITVERPSPWTTWNTVPILIGTGVAGLAFLLALCRTRSAPTNKESMPSEGTPATADYMQNLVLAESNLDSLTQLGSRLQLEDRVQLYIDNNRTDFAVLFLDIKRFKFVNDSLGHDCGDRLLCQVAQRLRRFFSDDIHRTPCARLGGDKFVVLLEHLTSNERATEIVARMEAILSEPYQIGRNTINVTFCFSLVYAGASYRYAMELLRDADTALFEAKRLDKPLITFDESIREKLTRRQLIESELYQAIDRNEIYLHYQPIVSLSTGKIHSLEALCRWKHSRLGFVSPAEFIPVAEETGLISEIGDWVFDEACRQFSLRLADLGDQCNELLCVNVSRRQLLDEDLIHKFRATIERYSLSPGRLELEITENAIAEDLVQAAQTLVELKQLGVRIALDDFGIGISSFASLHRFPVDTLKVDRSLTMDLLESPEAVALIQGLVVISERMEIDLVIEGIETQAQLELLQQLGCTLGQGYLFSQPLPANKVPELLQTDFSTLMREAASHG